jgi:cytidylate kinase
VQLGGRDVTDEIRTPRIDAAVPTVARHPAVRAVMRERQRELAETGDAVVEGRDIGTVVWPAAEVKVFLTASPEERARRRGGAGVPAESAEQVARRDHLDSSRAASPTRASDDALVLDSTDRPIEEVVDDIVRLVEAARARRAR